MLEIDGELYPETIALGGNNGEELAFELMDVVPLRGEKYYVLLPQESEESEPETVILKLKSGSGEEAELTGLESQTLLDEVYELFIKRVSAQDNADDIE